MTPALAPSLALAVVYMIWAPPSADLAAQTFRTELFEAHGFEVWSNAWYAGHHLPGYSVLYPPLASLIGIRLVGAASAIAAALLFAAIVRPRYGDRANLAIVLFGIGTATNLFTGRLTFALGVALGLAAVLAAERRRPGVAGVLSALTSLASPVAGLFAAFAGTVAWLTGRRRDGIALAVPALAAIALMALAFPTGGVEPFAGNTFKLITLAVVLVIVLAPPDERALRMGALLYVGMCLALFVFDTPIGGNATRLGALFAAPLLALASAGRRRPLVIALALVPLVYWQWVAPVRDLSDAVGEPSVEEAYYEPLLDEMDRIAPDAPFRVHVPATRNRWESVYVAERYPLARGWMRQLESDDFDLFQDGNLTAPAYGEWLGDRGVAFVAISLAAEPDYLAEDEIELIHGRLPYLREVWSSDDWELYEVENPVPLAEPGARLTALAIDGFTIEAAVAGDHLVGVHYSPYWAVVAGDGCVEAQGDWTLVHTDAAGTIEVQAELSAGGLIRALPGGGDRTCSG